MPQKQKKKPSVFSASIPVRVSARVSAVFAGAGEKKVVGHMQSGCFRLIMGLLNFRFAEGFAVSFEDRVTQGFGSELHMAQAAVGPWSGNSRAVCARERKRRPRGMVTLAMFNGPGDGHTVFDIGIEGRIGDKQVFGPSGLKVGRRCGRWRPARSSACAGLRYSDRYSKCSERGSPVWFAGFRHAAMLQVKLKMGPTRHRTGG